MFRKDKTEYLGEEYEYKDSSKYIGDEYGWNKKEKSIPNASAIQNYNARPKPGSNCTCYESSPKTKGITDYKNVNFGTIIAIIFAVIFVLTIIPMLVISTSDFKVSNPVVENNSTNYYNSSSYKEKSKRTNQVKSNSTSNSLYSASGNVKIDQFDSQISVSKVTVLVKIDEVLIKCKENNCSCLVNYIDESNKSNRFTLPVDGDKLKELISTEDTKFSYSIVKGSNEVPVMITITDTKIR